MRREIDSTSTSTEEDKKQDKKTQTTKATKDGWTFRDLSNIDNTLVRWRVDNSQIVKRQTSAKFCGVRRGAFEMSGSENY